MQNRRSARIYLISLPIAIAAIFAAVTFPNATLMQACFSRVAYYQILLLFFLWIFALIRWVQDSGHDRKAFLSSYGSGFLAALVLTVVVFISVPTELKVLADEANFLSVSRSMIFEKRTDIITEGHWYYMNFWPEVRAMEMRPLMFPFLVHLVHAFLGFHANNVFLLNLTILFLLLCLIYVFVKDNLGPLWGYAALILVVSQPVVSIYANSGGLDLAHTFFIVAGLMALRAFLHRPSAPSFLFLWMTLIVLANVRYESFTFFVIIMLSLIALRRVRAEFFKSSWAYSLTPLLVLPLFWQRLLKIKDVQFPEGTVLKAFHLENILRHTGAFLGNTFGLNFFQPYAHLVNLAGFVSILYFTGRSLFKRGAALNQTPQRDLAIISSIAIGALWLVITSYFFGKSDHPASARFFIFFSVVLSVFATFLLHKIAGGSGQKNASILMIPIAAFLIYHPVAIQDQMTRSLTIVRYDHFVLDFLKKQPDKNFLVICDRPGLFTAREFGAISFQAANLNASAISQQLQNELFNRLFVVQEISSQSKMPTPSTQLSNVFVLKPVVELQNSPEAFIRISRALRPVPFQRPSQEPAGEKT